MPRGGIPDLQRLADDLVATEYSYNSDDAILLEKKEHMNVRGDAVPMLHLCCMERPGARRKRRKSVIFCRSTLQHGCNPSRATNSLFS